jgi:hypothetical protein
MAERELPTSSADPLAGIASLVQALGGSKTSSNPGDISALQQVLAQLQGTDYEGMLKGIFQQAAGNIPGLQQAFGNAAGARSGGNSAVQAALSKLLQQTVVGAQEKIANQQLQNQQIQAGAAANIAQATKGTKSTAGTSLGQAAQMLAGLQLFGKLRSSFNDENGIGGLIDSFKNGGAGNGTATNNIPFESGFPDSTLRLGGNPAPVQMTSPVLDFSGGNLDFGTSDIFDLGGGNWVLGDNNFTNPDFMGPPNIQGFEDLGQYF